MKKKRMNGANPGYVSIDECLIVDSISILLVERRRKKR